MYVPFHADGIVSQFEGYPDLRELDLEHYRADPNIRRLDRILKAEGEDPNRYQVAKQADGHAVFPVRRPGTPRVVRPAGLRLTWN